MCAMSRCDLDLTFDIAVVTLTFNILSPSLSTVSILFYFMVLKIISPGCGVVRASLMLFLYVICIANVKSISSYFSL